MKRTLIASAAIAAALGLAEFAEAQTVYPMQMPYLAPPAAALPYQVSIPPRTSSDEAASNINCQPPGIRAAGSGALPASTQPC